MRRALLILVSLAAAAIGAGLAPAIAAADNSQGPIVRFATSLGNIDVQLLPQYAPNTVTNFLSYVNNGAYATTFFHRSVQQGQSGYGVIQGGSYEVVSGFRGSIPTTTPVALEYNLPNSAGTLAMARTNNPNSATSGWFFNVTDNSSVFGPSNGGGYAVFGQILSLSGYQVMDAVAGQRIVDDSFGDTMSPYSQLPVMNYSGANPVTSNDTLTTANLIMSPITVVNDTTAPTITIAEPTNGELFTQGETLTPRFTCNDGANSDGSAGTGVASCTSSPVDLSVPGHKTFTVSTTDYAGNATSQSVNYTVNPAPPAPTPIVTPPPPKPHPPAAKPAVLTGSLTATKSGKLPLRLRCPTSVRCTGTITLSTLAAHHRTVRIGFARYTIGAHRTTKLTVRLSSAARALLRRHHRLAVTVVLKPNGARTRAHTQRAQLRLGTR